MLFLLVQNTGKRSVFLFDRNENGNFLALCAHPLAVGLAARILVAGISGVVPVSHIGNAVPYAMISAEYIFGYI